MHRASLFGVLLAACSGSSGATDAHITGGESVAIDSAAPTRYVAYISGGADIAWYDVDKATGALSPISSIAAFRSGANFLAVHGINLYAVTNGDRVGAYAINPTTAGLTFVNDVSSGGTGPAHVSVDASGAYVLVANYGSGHIVAVPVQPGGGLGSGATPILAGANAHQIVADPSNRFVLVPCLGNDKVAQYTFDPGSGALTANSVPKMDTASGAGPRHLAFAPDGKHAYLINETNSTLQTLSWDATTGRLASLQTVTTRANGASGANTTAEVIVHPNGKFVYGSNRGDNNIVVFSIDATSGMVTAIDHTSTQGTTPRMFTIDPTGTLMYVANQGSNNVVPFKIDPATGLLSPTAAPIAATTPQFVGIVPLPL